MRYTVKLDNCCFLWFCNVLVICIFIDGKTLCEVLTAADTMPLPMPVQESTVSCPGMVSCSRPPNGATTASRAGCRGMVAVSLSYRPIPAQKPCHPAMP